MQYWQTERPSLNLIKEYKQQYENEKKSDCDLYINYFGNKYLKNYLIYMPQEVEVAVEVTVS